MTKQPITFGLEQSAYCCGIHELGGFEQRDGRSWDGRKIHQELKNKQAVLTRFSTDLARTFEDQFRYTDNWSDGAKFLVTASLVKSYSHTPKQAQFPELAEWFKENGWTVAYEFVNPNSGNTVEVFQRWITAEDCNVQIGDNGENEDDDDNW